jgi:pyridoxal phosphate enzyme (YggS family)
MAGSGSEIRSALERVRDAIAEACSRAGRDPGEVRLVAVTKTVDADRVRAARDAGVEDFAESYARELSQKAPLIDGRWHFVGKLQLGTAGKVADLADVIHSAEPGRALQRIAGRAERTGRNIECLVQVDFTGRRQGLDPDGVEAFLEEFERWPALRLMGLMTIPPPILDPGRARPYFARLRNLRDELRPAHPELVELSMGMSGDYSVAVEEGATMVRVGTALFGGRPVKAATRDGEALGPDER